MGLIAPLVHVGAPAPRAAMLSGEAPTNAVDPPGDVGATDFIQLGPWPNLHLADEPREHPATTGNPRSAVG